MGCKTVSAAKNPHLLPPICRCKHPKKPHLLGMRWVSGAYPPVSAAYWRVFFFEHGGYVRLQRMYTMQYHTPLVLILTCLTPLLIPKLAAVVTLTVVPSISLLLNCFFGPNSLHLDNYRVSALPPSYHTFVPKHIPHPIYLCTST